MRVIAKRMLREFWERVAATRSALEDWHKRTEKAVWKRPQDAKATFGRADPMMINGRNVIVFDILGNRYRLITTVSYATDTRLGIVFTREIITHAEYDLDQWKRRIL
jgi:mRNA interferase HigB